MTKALFAGDSYIATYGSWTATIVSTHGYTWTAPYTNPAYNSLDVNSPAFNGTCLMNFFNTGPALVANFSTRVGQYCDSTTNLYFHIGINDLYAMARNLTLTSAAGSTANFDDWYNNLVTLGGSINALGANKPAKVFFNGLPYISGVAMPPPPSLPPHYRGHQTTARLMMNAISAEVATQFGWTYVSLDTMIPDDIIVGDVHPNANGTAYIAGQVLAAGG